MKVSRSFLKLARKALAESIDFSSMVHLARELIPNYNIFMQKKVSENISISRIEAAEQIINDMYENNLLMQFLNVLLGIQFRGHMGRKYKISGLNELLKSIHDMGFMYDNETQMLMEHPRYRISRNWGALIEGDDYFFSFLWIDIMGYSRLVKKYPKKHVEAVYMNFVETVRKVIEKRNGRIWIMEGDGILSAFHFLNKSQMSVLSGIEIIHELDSYNLFHNVLDSPIKVKISIHNGKSEYCDDNEKTKKSEVIRETIGFIKRASIANQIVISNNVESMLDPILSNSMNPVKKGGLPEYYTYSLQWEK